MHFRIPTHLKQTITIVRKSAYERNTETSIATDVICMIVPKTDSVQVVNGVGISDVEWTAFLETPVDNIIAGDILRRADSTELLITRVRQLGAVPLLTLKEAEVI